jgi:hypothetical protein
MGTENLCPDYACGPRSEVNDCPELVYAEVNIVGILTSSTCDCEATYGQFFIGIYRRP